MKSFIKCRGVNVDTGIILLAEDAIKRIYRTDREERADILEDFDGNFYECYHDFITFPSYTDCIVYPPKES